MTTYTLKKIYRVFGIKVYTSDEKEYQNENY